MNKTAIKNFSIWARNKLISDVRYQAGLIGITEAGISNKLPQSVGMTEFYDIGTDTPYQITGDAIKQRENLIRLLNNKTKESNYKTAYKYILEEVAYTWFNRLIAIRFMEINDYLPGHCRILSSENAGKLEPDIVSDPFNSGLTLSSQETAALNEMRVNNDLDGMFKLLFVKTCNSLNPILPGLFEETADYTELLLNLSIVDQDGVISRLVNDIPEEEFDVNRGGQVEIIGWLYQYYNTEPKNDAFAKNGKITKEEIPAVTQLFTPDWIVRCMVENSLGRIWLEGHHNKQLRDCWRYYIDSIEQDSDVQQQLAELYTAYSKLRPEDLKIIDPCMGSGHVLVYAFDVLIQIYESVGYSTRDAAKLILDNNLYGLDIDDRAYQMAYFAVMMKARQYNRRILSPESKCHVYSIRESNRINRSHLTYMGSNMSREDRENAHAQIVELLDSFIDAKEYGSILCVKEYNWKLLKEFVNDVQHAGQLSLDMVGVEETSVSLIQLIEISEVLASKYDVVVTNPPYMGSGNMTSLLSEYVRAYYPESKNDMFAVLMERTFSMLKPQGLQSMITMESWMFLSGFENMRHSLNHNKSIFALIHMPYLGKGRTSLGINFGTDIAVIANFRISRYVGTYDRISYYETDENGVPYSFPVKNQYYKHISQDQFFKIPGEPLAYWCNKRVIESFAKSLKASDFGKTSKGLITGDNAYSMRVWWEIEKNKICFSAQSFDDAEVASHEWFPCNKGGAFRKWYGNEEYIIHWINDGANLLAHAKSIGHNFQNYDSAIKFKPYISWSDLTSGSPSFRIKNHDISEHCGMSFVPSEEDIPFFLALFNSNTGSYMFNILSPTYHLNIGELEKFPVVRVTNKEKINVLVQQCINICKDDWNCSTTSWGFTNLCITGGKTMGRLISEKYSEWETICNERFNQLKANEEELNRIFIDIYGLQDELTPEVEDKDVTVRKAELKRDIKSLLSYAVGCMFGRYSLDVEGLAYAGGDWDDSKYVSFIPDKDNVIPITDEEYLEDDIVARLVTWLKIVYGEDTLEQNLDFIANALGNKGNSSRSIIRNYFLNDFFIDHCQTYSVTGSGKRPIYWLFDSGKQNGFKALVYLHRYNADTIGNLRVDYLHRIQRIYESEIARMQDTIDNSTNNRDVAQATKRKEKLTKQLKECREYDEKIGHLALSRIELNLDDGVKVNYKKLQTANDGLFYEVLANSKNIMVKEK